MSVLWWALAAVCFVGMLLAGWASIYFHYLVPLRRSPWERLSTAFMSWSAGIVAICLFLGAFFAARAGIS